MVIKQRRSDEKDTEKQLNCKHLHKEKGFVDGGALGESCLDCGKSWRSTWQGD